MEPGHSTGSVHRKHWPGTRPDPVKIADPVTRFHLWFAHPYPTSLRSGTGKRQSGVLDILCCPGGQDIGPSNCKLRPKAALKCTVWSQCTPVPDRRTNIMAIARRFVFAVPLHCRIFLGPWNTSDLISMVAFTFAMRGHPIRLASGPLSTSVWQSLVVCWPPCATPASEAEHRIHGGCVKTPILYFKPFVDESSVPNPTEVSKCIIFMVVSSEISSQKFPEIYSNLMRKFVNYLCQSVVSKSTIVKWCCKISMFLTNNSTDLYALTLRTMFRKIIVLSTAPGNINKFKWKLQTF